MAEAAHSTQPCRGIAHHLAEHVEQTSRDGDDGQQLDQIGERVGVLKGMGRVGVEEAAAVGAQLFDDLLGGHRPLGDHLGLCHRACARPCRG